MLLENLFVVLARTTLGLFLSIVLAVVAYLGTLILVIQVSDLESVNYRLMATLAIGIGAGLGGFLGWLKRDLSMQRQILMVMAAVIISVIGAWVGEQFEKTTWGAVLGGNMFLSSLGTWKALRDS